VDVIRVPWSGASFLAYLGGFTILFGALTFLSVEANEQSDAGFVLWAAVAYAVLALLSYAALNTGHRIIAGLLAVATVAAFGVLIGALFDWFGWWPQESESPFGEFDFAVLALELLTLLASVVAWRIFRFPLLVFLIAVSAWFFVTDLISNGGDWSAIVTVFIGVIFFAAAGAADAGESRVSGFWLHVASGLTIGGGLLWFFHDGDFDWIIVGLAGLAYIAIGDRLARSSWIVIGAWGLLQTASYFADKWGDLVAAGFFPLGFLLSPFFLFGADFATGETGNPWVGPLVYAACGLLFFVIAVVLARRRRATTPGAELI
jgi:hypothetical protein